MAMPGQPATLQEYFSLEAQSDIRYEYHDGQIVAMTGASLKHNRIVFNTAGLFYMQLKGGHTVGLREISGSAFPSIAGITIPI